MSECRYALSEKDEYVADGYIGIYELFRNPRYALPGCDPAKWCIGKDELSKMRYETYREVKKRFDMCKASDYSRFWNGHVDAINSLGLNRFANLLFFKEIATAMVCFQDTVKNKGNDNKRRFVSFGIKDSIYREYYKSQREALRTGSKPVPVNLFDSHKKRTGNIFKLPKATLAFDTEDSGKQMLKISQNAVFNMFEFWCKAKGVNKTDGIYQAMRLLIETYPVTELKELGAYVRKCDLDYVEVVVPETISESVKANLYIPKGVHDQMRKIIDNYNADPDNIGKPTMTIPKYVNNAILRLNQNSPLRYSDPEKYKEYVKAKQAEEYNKEVLG